MGFTKNHSEVVILLQDGGQDRRCSSGAELRRLRRLGGAQTVGKAVCAPRNDSSSCSVNLRIVGLEPRVSQNDGGKRGGEITRSDMDSW